MKIDYKNEFTPKEKRTIYLELLRRNIRSDVEISNSTTEDGYNTLVGDVKFRERKPKTIPDIIQRDLNRPPGLPPVKKIGQVSQTDLEINKRLENYQMNDEYDYSIAKFETWKFLGDMPDNASKHIAIDKDLYIKGRRKK
jgi:hypothetical protein